MRVDNTTATKSIKLNRWLNKYTAQIKMDVPTKNLADIPVYDIPHPTQIIHKGKTSLVIWHLKGYIKGDKAKEWYNDIVTKISLCLDGKSIIDNVNKELTKPINNRVYELDAFRSVEDLRYDKKHKLFYVNANDKKGDYQFTIISSIAYSLARNGTLTKDRLDYESRLILVGINEKWYKYQINNIFEWVSTNYQAGSKKRVFELTRSERAKLNSKSIKETNYKKVERAVFIALAFGLDINISKISTKLKLARNTVKNHLKSIKELFLVLGGQSIRHIRGFIQNNTNKPLVLLVYKDLKELIPLKRKYESREGLPLSPP